MAADRTPFHIFCIKCSQCNKKLTPASINEHEKKLFCPSCYEDIFNKQVSEISSECIYFQCLLWQDDIPERMVMQVLPIQGMFIVVSVIEGCTYGGQECKFKKWSIPRSQRRKMSFCHQMSSGRGRRQRRRPAPGRRPPWGPTPCSQQSESGKPVRLLLMTA